MWVTWHMAYYSPLLNALSLLQLQYDILSLETFYFICVLYIDGYNTDKDNLSILIYKLMSGRLLNTTFLARLNILSFCLVWGFLLFRHPFNNWCDGTISKHYSCSVRNIFGCILKHRMSAQSMVCILTPWDASIEPRERKVFAHSVVKWCGICTSVPKLILSSTLHALH